MKLAGKGIELHSPEKILMRTSYEDKSLYISLFIVKGIDQNPKQN